MQNVAAISELVKPFDARLISRYPINTRINTLRTMMKNARDPWSLLRLRIDSSRRGIAGQTTIFQC